MCQYYDYKLRQIDNYTTAVNYVYCRNRFILYGSYPLEIALKSQYREHLALVERLVTLQHDLTALGGRKEDISYIFCSHWNFD